MEYVQFPRTRFLFGLLLVAHTLVYLGMLCLFPSIRLDTALMSFGLCLDIFGAAILALPDFPGVKDRLRSNYVRWVRDRLERAVRDTEVVPEELEPNPFSEIKTALWVSDTFEQKEGKVGLYSGDITKMTRFVKRVEEDQFVMEQSDGVTQSIPWSVVRQVLNEYVNILEGRTRRSGLVLLITGFLNQLAAIVV